MTALPVIEMVSRQFRWSGIPGSAVVVQQLTLWIGMLGGMLASRSDRLLGLSSSSIPSGIVARTRENPFRRGPGRRLHLPGLGQLGLRDSERESGSYLLPGVPKWTALAIMLVGFAVIALRAVWNASKSWKGRAIAALGLFIPALFGYVIPVGARRAAASL